MRLSSSKCFTIFWWVTVLLRGWF